MADTKFSNQDNLLTAETVTDNAQFGVANNVTAPDTGTTATIAVSELSKTFNKIVDGFTVGAKGDYPATQAGLQDAINAIVALPQFEETGGTGTVSITQDTTLLTGSGTSWLTEFSGDIAANSNVYISFTGDATRKWYPIRQVISDTELVLGFNFSDATVAAGTSYQTAYPIMRSISILDNMKLDKNTEKIYFTTDGTGAGGRIDALAVKMIWPNGSSFGAEVRMHISSGIFIIDGLLANATDTPRFHALNTGTKYYSALNLSILNTKYNGYAGFLNSLQDVFGSIFVEGQYIGRHGVLLASAAKQHAKGVYSEVYAAVDTQPQGNIALVMTSDVPNAEVIVDNTNVLISRDISATGNREAIGLYIAGKQDSTVRINNCIIEATHDANATIDASSRLRVIKFGDFETTDVYISNTNIRLLGADVAINENNHHNFYYDVTAPDTSHVTLHIDNCQFADLPSLWLDMNIGSISGDMGDKSTFVNSAAPAQGEICPLRASRFHFTVGGALTIPAPSTMGPKGHKFAFHFTQDVTGGHAVTFNAAFNTNASFTASGTSNQHCIVEFQSDGSAYYQSNSSEWF